jgi:hypothetical protein
MVKIPMQKHQTIAAALSVIGMSLFLNLLGISWGQPGGYDWTPDSIAGSPSVTMSNRILEPWKGKYPRLHYMINAAAYAPFIAYWKSRPKPPKAEIEKQLELSLPVSQASTLIIVSRVISALMGAAAVLAVFLIVLAIFKDLLAAWLAALSLAFSALFVFYSHVGNVDVPLTFWLAWSIYFTVQSLYRNRLSDYVSLGICSACAISTKDPAAGYILGLGVAALVVSIADVNVASGQRKKFDSRLLVAAAVFLVAYALLNDLFTSPETYIRRIGKWLGPEQHRWTRKWGGHANLLITSLKSITLGMGWPLALTTVAAAIYGAYRYRLKTLLILMPFVMFYTVVTTTSKLSIPRYFIPAYIGFSIICGKATADFIRWKKMHLVLRIAPVAAILILSFFHALGVDLEMIYDTRIRAEGWMNQNIKPNQHAACVYPPVYGPRLHNAGFIYTILQKKHRRQVTREQFDQLEPPADYVVLSNKAFSQILPELRKPLIENRMGYKTVQVFRRKFLKDDTIFGLAGYKVGFDDFLSPTITILKRWETVPLNRPTVTEAEESTEDSQR